MAKVKKQKVTKAQLERKIFELKAQLASTYHFANQTIDKANIDRMTGSNVILQLTELGGKNIILPVAIRDGLSSDTIKAIKADLKRSYDLATLFKL